MGLVDKHEYLLLWYISENDIQQDISEVMAPEIKLKRHVRDCSTVKEISEGSVQPEVRDNAITMIGASTVHM